MTFTTSVRRAAWGMLGAAAVALPLTAAQAADPIRIVVIYDFTGPFAAGGSQAAAIGTQIAIDMIN